MLKAFVCSSAASRVSALSFVASGDSALGCGVNDVECVVVAVNVGNSLLIEQRFMYLLAVLNFVGMCDV
jgi:hypothetical protein